jgi:succinylarginine dihydrolase
MSKLTRALAELAKRADAGDGRVFTSQESLQTKMHRLPKAQCTRSKLMPPLKIF